MTEGEKKTLSVEFLSRFSSDFTKNWAKPLSLTEVEKLIVKSIYSGKLAQVSYAILEQKERVIQTEARLLAERAIRVCRSISESTKIERKNMYELLTKAGIETTVLYNEVDKYSLQNHRFSIMLAPEYLDNALDHAYSKGYISWVPWKNGAWECYKRFRNRITLVKTDHSTTRMEFKWGKESKRRLTSKLWPSELDFDLVDLPSTLWILYFFVKPFRVIRNKLFGRTSYSEPWPFLGTPIQLTQELFKMVKLTTEDILVDMGCGDGRIVIEAAKQYGCRTMGIELDDSLARLAQQKVVSESLEELVTIKRGDAYTVPLPTEPCVVFLFLPIENIPDIIDLLHRKLAPGSRIITHEQNEINLRIPPVSSKAILTESAITVAHLWTL